MTRPLIGALACWFIALSGASGAVVYQSVTQAPGPGELATFDLDGDSAPDIQLDVRQATWLATGGAYVLDGLNGSTIAAEGGITTSFSVGQRIDISALVMVGPGVSILTGGHIADSLGNSIVEGWGGVTEYDEFGNPIIPPGAPIHQIDLFLVSLADGVAWVDLDSYNIGFGWITASWGYTSPVDGSFAITGIPEGSTQILGLLGFLFTLQRRR